MVFSPWCSTLHLPSRVVPLTPVRYIVASLSTPDQLFDEFHTTRPRSTASMSLVVPEAHVQFQHILRLLNTNVDGKRKIMVRPRPLFFPRPSSRTRGTDAGYASCSTP